MKKYIHMDAIIKVDAEEVKAMPRGVWGAVRCLNTECKHYWEHSCTKNLEGKSISLDDSGMCEDFRAGVSELYTISKESEVK